MIRDFVEDAAQPICALGADFDQCITRILPGVPDGDLFDLSPAITAVDALLATSPRVSLDFIATSDCETGLGTLAQSFENNPRVMQTTASTADPRRLAKTLQQRLAWRLYAPLPPLTKKPAARKSPPAL